MNSSGSLSSGAISINPNYVLGPGTVVNGSGGATAIYYEPTRKDGKTMVQGLYVTSAQVKDGVVGQIAYDNAGETIIVWESDPVFVGKDVDNNDNPLADSRTQALKLAQTRYAQVLSQLFA